MIADFKIFCQKWGDLHSGVELRGIVRFWLRISYAIGRLFFKIRISANAVTIFGIGFSLATVVASPHLWAALFLFLSLICDGIDGSVAIVRGKTSPLGALFDAIADRLSEALWAIALYRLGVPLSLVIAIWVIAAFQEFARARLGSDGVREVGVITVAERPVRALLLTISILIFGLSNSSGWVNFEVIFLGLLEMISLCQVLNFAWKSLRTH